MTDNMSAEPRPLTAAEIGSKGGKNWWNSLSDEEKRKRVAKLAKARKRAARARKAQAAAQGEA